MDGGMVPIEDNAGPPDGAEETRDRRDPLRRCLASGTVQPKDGMIRFVIAPDGGVVPDVDGTLPGRGLWLSADGALVARAVAKNLFAKAARQKVRVDEDLLPRLTALLERRCLDFVGLARRAGLAVAGFEKVRAALASGRIGKTGAPGLLLAAADGAADGRGKLRALAGGLPLLELFESGALGAALGRDHTVHALIARGALADRLRVDAGRLMGLRALPAGRPPAGQPINDGPVG